MAGNGKHGGGDRVLESRHLVGLFLGVVLLCGVFFTLGYVMGRTQYGGAVHAADAPLKSAAPSSAASSKPLKGPATAKTPVSPDPGGWLDENKTSTPDHLEPAAKSAPAPVAKPPAPIPAVTPKSSKAEPVPRTKTIAAPRQPAARFQPPPMTKNSIVLQVAAIKVQKDALEMADEIQRKKFPAFVATAPADNLYHVQIGPYSDMASADSAKRALEQLGFKPIIKH